MFPLETLTLSKASSKLSIIFVAASVPLLPSFFIFDISSLLISNDSVLMLSILTFNVCESEVFAPTCKLISFPDIFVVVLSIFPKLTSALASISAVAVNLILFPFESVIVNVLPDFIFLLTVSKSLAAIPYLLLALLPNSIPLVVTLTFKSFSVKSSKSNPS